MSKPDTKMPIPDSGPDAGGGGGPKTGLEFERLQPATNAEGTTTETKEESKAGVGAESISGPECGKPGLGGTEVPLDDSASRQV